MDLYPTSQDLLYINCADLQAKDRADLDAFSFRVQSMPPIYVYQLSRQSIWQAKENGWTARDVIEWIRFHAVSPVPLEMQRYIVEVMAQYRQLQIVGGQGGNELHGDEETLQRLRSLDALQPFLTKTPTVNRMIIRDQATWSVKNELLKRGYSVVDERQVKQKANRIHFELQDVVQLRTYQRAAVRRFFESDTSGGVMVLPCGSGKTVVGVAIAAEYQKSTLVLVPSETAARQWHAHFKTWTTIKDGEIAIDDGKSELRPITITTYQRLTARNRRGAHHHLDRYTNAPFGLVIYDEVHLLPAPLFRLAALLQPERSLGLSATLVREDGRASDVYALIGRKLYEVHSDDLIRQGYLSHVRCIEVKVPLSDVDKRLYELAPTKDRHRIAADNVLKMEIVQNLCHRHEGSQILVMGHYTSFLRDVSVALNCPMLDGRTTKQRRLEVYERFRQGDIRVLALSRIANMAVDLPNADIAIQISGLFGSRQEEAQRLGRLLRPNDKAGGIFYSLVTQRTVEERTAHHRQQYLVESGFAYNWTTADEITRERAD